MSNFFAIIPFLLCAVISQAAPMVKQKDITAPAVPSPPSDVKTPGSQQTTSVPEECPPGSEPVECTVSCSKEPELPKSNTSKRSWWRKSTGKPSENPKEMSKAKSKKLEEKSTDTKKTTSNTAEETSQETPKGTSQATSNGGWVNALKNLAYSIIKAVNDSLVGEKGVLTTWPQNFRSGKAVVQKPEKRSSRNGSTIACCIFGNRPPPVDDDNENEEESETNVDPRPINFTYVVDGVSVPLSASNRPHVQTHTQNTRNSNCCVGRQIFNLRKLFKCNNKNQTNTCTITINTTVADVTM